MSRGAVLVWLCLLAAGNIGAQTDPILIKSGRVIDPRNGLDGVMDVLVRDGVVKAVAPMIASDGDETVIDASGLVVVPGLVDIHTHVFYGTEPDAYLSNGFAALPPDGFTLRSGVTTVVDLGGAGWRNFNQFREQVIERSRTRVLSFLNIVGAGMKGGPREQNLADMDAKLTAMRAKEHPELIVGIKLAHYAGSEWAPVERAVAAAREASIPVAVDFGGHDPPLSLESLLLDHLADGDIFTHTFAHVSGREPIVDENGELRVFLPSARERGIVFDVGHGGGSFLFAQAVPAVAQGFLPDTISTDLHRSSVNGGMKDLLHVMSKFLALGMTLQDVVRASTSTPSETIGRDDLGHLGVGAVADIAVLGLRRGTFGFIDTAGLTQPGDEKLECELTLRAGEVVWDLNGISRPAWRARP